MSVEITKHVKGLSLISDGVLLRVRSKIVSKERGKTTQIYCRFGIFRENIIFANSIKIHISDVENSRLRQDLSKSINERVILPFREGFYFHATSHMRISQK